MLCARHGSSNTRRNCRRQRRKDWQLLTESNGVKPEGVGIRIPWRSCPLRIHLDLGAALVTHFPGEDGATPPSPLLGAHSLSSPSFPSTSPRRRERKGAKKSKNKNDHKEKKHEHQTIPQKNAIPTPMVALIEARSNAYLIIV